ncbi:MULTISPECIES: amidohydrolase family protein [Pseudidiomarina]|uniref:Imidazolonepropionase-like amidohydrolase n=3 Tax=Pseudidiomarina TaxID=2800384 RepID=A0A368UYJ1_9GAMM|nr:MULTISPECIES: amidohydrolase family protein [Pseudidiomarina]MDT7525680.1 amidohydrolase family protein [Pseudidiomarina sp. GXY010]PWW13702.1 imidazolonepropionase-like amidohydrolase [Pseudidiomarina maritima]RBP91096.1 imidazolonepropionase-like amidohydrolase [Pseudidiomarina tainanensis]RCW33110.1 imidazolonepropionase-like amidohydrolase [Pseudidiomarina tainanensis]
MRTLLSASILLALSGSAYADTLVYAGTLIDGTQNKPQQQMTIVIDEGRIIGIEQGYKTATADDLVIDRKDSTVMPGFIDMHTHLTSQLGPGSYMNKFTKSAADVTLDAVSYAEKTLLAGFTTVRELGDSYNASIALRDAIQAGKVRGPRIYSAGKSIATTGGHADPTNGAKEGLYEQPTPADGVVDGPYDARKAVRARYQDGADLIKLTVTGGVLSVAKSGHNPQFMMDELREIVTTAKDYGMKVTVHAHGKEGMLRAIEAGVDSIEHGTYMDKEVMRAMKKNNVYYVPTITAGRSVADRAKIDGYFPELVRPKAAEIGPKIQNTFAEAYKYGVKIAFGTDAGVYDHGENYREFQYMVEAGMPPLEAIRAATAEAATLLGVSDIGTLKVGNKADVVAVPGNPLEDISLMSEINLVIKDGQVYKQ